MKALQSGDKVLKELQKQTSIEDWEELYENHQDNLRTHDMEVEMFGQALDDDVLADELDKLVADQVASEIAEPETAPIFIKKPVAEQEEEEEQVVVR